MLYDSIRFPIYFSSHLLFLLHYISSIFFFLLENRHIQQPRNDDCVCYRQLTKTARIYHRITRPCTVSFLWQIAKHNVVCSCKYFCRTAIA